MELINKYDFQHYCNIGFNIDEAKLAPHIKDARLFDVLPVIPEALFNAILGYSPNDIKQWSRTATYNNGAYVLYNGEYWVFNGVITTVTPPSTGAGWARIITLAFWAEYLKPYFVHSAAVRFMLWHGRNVTQYGLRSANEDTSVEITDKARAELMNDLESKANHYKARMLKELDLFDYTLDGVTYERNNCGNQANKPTFKIMSV